MRNFYKVSAITAIFFISVYRVFLNDASVIIKVDSLIRFGILSYLVIYSFPSKNKIRFNHFQLLGLGLSFFSILLFNPTSIEVSFLVALAFVSNFIFYSIFLIKSYLDIGKAFSIIPEAKDLVVKGVFSKCRHPIYATAVYIAINYSVLFFSFENILATILLTLGVWIRAREEEEILSTAFVGYTDYAKKVKSRFIYIPCIIPLIVLLLVKLNFSLLKSSDVSSNEHNQLVIHISIPATSINPTVYDDWGSLFIANHIFPRLFPQPNRPNISYIGSEFDFECRDKKKSYLDPLCKNVEILFNIQPFETCSGLKISKDDIIYELEMILAKKKWILPNWKKCDGQKDVCIEVEAVSDIERRLKNLYFRFGWKDSSLKEGALIGVEPYCLKVVKLSDEGFILKAALEPRKNYALPSLSIVNDNEPVRFDISLYGHELNGQEYEQIQSNTPIGYYLIANPISTSLSSVPVEVDRLIVEHLQESNLVFSDEIVNFNLLPKGNLNISKNIKDGRKSFYIPDYIPGCESLAQKISTDFLLDAKCRDLNILVMNYVLGQKEWDFLISPLTPGAPYRNALVEQYFLSESLGAWSASKSGNETFRLVAVGKSLITIRKGVFCGVESNSMGLGDVTIDDFIQCD